MAHFGPDYGGVPSGTEYDNGSSTYDNARGGYRVAWDDRFNKHHQVDVPANEVINVSFPIPAGGDWIWFQANGSQERTGFNGAVTWVEAQFYRDGNHVRIHSTGWRAFPQDPGLWGDVINRISDVATVASLGAKTAQEAMTIATAIGAFL